jgi:hypothetical protein
VSRDKKKSRPDPEPRSAGTNRSYLDFHLSVKCPCSAQIYDVGLVRHPFRENLYYRWKNITLDTRGQRNMRLECGLEEILSVDSGGLGVRFLASNS